MDDSEETNAARSFVSFSSEKETKEPWPPPLLSLGDDMLNPDPEGGVGQEGGEWRGRQREPQHGQRRGGERCAIHRLFFLREGDEGALASSSLVSLGDDVGSGFISLCTNSQT